MSAATPGPDDWVYRSKLPVESRLRLICLPYAGGGAAIYRLWQDEMPLGVEVCRVQLPGRETRLREKPYSRLADLIEQLLPVLRPLLDLPFAIYGHSMGGLTAFELARAIRREFGKTPAHLFASGWRAPQLPLSTALHALPDTEFVEKLQARFSGIPPALLQEPELMEMMLPILRADLAMCETYSYRQDAPLDCPISVFGGHDDHWINESELAAWAAQTTRTLDLEMFPGDHFFLNDERRMVPNRVSETLTRTCAGL